MVYIVLQMLDLSLHSDYALSLLVVESVRDGFEFDLNIFLQHFPFAFTLLFIMLKRINFLLCFRSHHINVLIHILSVQILACISRILNFLNDMVGARVRLLRYTLFTD